MPASAQSNRDSDSPRRSPRLKNIHMIYDEGSDTDSLSLTHGKIEVTDVEEILSPSTSLVTVASVSDKDVEQGFHNISLKDLRARCKAKNLKASQFISDGPDIKNQTHNWSIDDGKAKEEFDLDKPLIALKRKKQRISPSKANKNIDVLPSSLSAVKVENTSEINQIPTLGQISLLEARMHGSMSEKLERRSTDLEHSSIAVDCIREIVGEEDCCAKVESPVESLVNHEKSDIQDICSEEAGTFCHTTPSCPDGNCFEYSAVESQQLPREDDQCRPQPCFINQPTKSAHVDHTCELISSTKVHNLNDVAEKETDIVSSLDLIDEVSDHQKTPESTANSDTDKYSIENGFSLCFVNQSCNDYTYDDEYWNTEVVEGNEPKTVMILEELSPIYESNKDIVSPLVSIETDLCGSTYMKCNSLEEIVQMQGDSQLNTTICCDLRPKLILQDKEIKHTTDYTFVFDKTHDLAIPANFVTQDGRLESIVYEALNHHTPKITSEKTSSVGGLPDTAVVCSPDVTDNCPADEISLSNYAEHSLKNMDMLNSRIDYGICKSVSIEGPGEFQAQSFMTYVKKETTSHVLSEISIEETQEIHAGAPESSATSLKTENQNVESDIFIDEESVEEHGPKKLLSKRKIMSPTSQEKLCNALTGIDLCGVKRLKNDIIVEDHEESGMSLPHPAHNHDQSAFSPDRRLRGRMSVSPTCNGVPKAGETPSHQTTCSCKRSSPVVLDTEKAVEFSQRQMHDMENIAAKLIRSLKHMRSIVDETLSSEAHSVVPNFNIAKVRAASEDALEVEKTTKKWLAIMNKDCNRFCKILTLAKKNDVSAHEAPRKQRKITFADEAGGKLCHVKVFKDRHTSLLSERNSDL